MVPYELRLGANEADLSIFVTNFSQCGLEVLVRDKEAQRPGARVISFQKLTFCVQSDCRICLHEVLLCISRFHRKARKSLIKFKGAVFAKESSTLLRLDSSSIITKTVPKSN